MFVQIICQAKCSGLRAIVVAEKQTNKTKQKLSDDAENNITGA